MIVGERVQLQHNRDIREENAEVGFWLTDDVLLKLELSLKARLNADP